MKFQSKPKQGFTLIPRCSRAVIVLARPVEHEHAWKRGPQAGSLQNSVDVHLCNGNTSHAVEPRKYAPCPVDTKQWRKAIVCVAGPAADQ